MQTMQISLFLPLSLQYAMFLSLVFLAELVAGISGFVFRHEVSMQYHMEPLFKSNTKRS